MTDRFTDSGTPGAANIVAATQCRRCRHLRSANWTCAAFPAGIPALILRGRFDHAIAYPGDNGVRFDPLPGEASPFEGITSDANG